MTEADEVIAALRSGHDELAAQVAGLSPEDLTRPSGASEWSVAQVLSHLGSGAVITLARLESSLSGADAPGPDFNKQTWAHWDALGPQQQADEFVAADAALVDRYESIDPETRESLRIELGFIPFPLTLAQAARMRLNEVALHAWDVQVAFDPAATVAPAAARALLHGAPNRIGRLAKTEVLGGRETTVDVTTTDPGSAFALVLGEATDTVLDAAPSSDSRLTLPAESWLRLISGRLSPEHTPAAVVAEGPVTLDVLRQVFPGY